MQDQPLRSTTADQAAPGSAQDHRHTEDASLHQTPPASAEASADVCTSATSQSCIAPAGAGAPPATLAGHPASESTGSRPSDDPPVVTLDQLALDLIQALALPELVEHIRIDLNGQQWPKVTVTSLHYPDDPEAGHEPLRQALLRRISHYELRPRIERVRAEREAAIDAATIVLLNEPLTIRMEGDTVIREWDDVRALALKVLTAARQAGPAEEDGQ